jgi:hypothetical protein
MRSAVAISLLSFMPCAAFSTIIDRIAVIVGNSIVKDSDIERDLRVADFLDGAPLDLGKEPRKKAARRLIDQIFIRREIRIGDYPAATPEEATRQLDSLKKQRFKTNAAYQDALRRYGLTEPDLRTEFQWQLTVLRFIDARFKPAVLITDQQIEQYYGDHRAALARAHPGKASLQDLQEDIRETLTGEKVNQLFFSWLDEQRQGVKIQFQEASLT